MITFQNILQQHNVPTAPENHEHSRAGWVNIDCPQCSPNSHHWRLGYNLRGGYLSCWACGYRPLIGTLAAILRQPTGVVRRLVADIPTVAKFDEPLRGNLVLPDGVGPLLDCHRRYLADRGYDVDELVRIWGVGGIGMAPKLAWRVYIPFYFQGRVVSWMTRGIEGAARHRSASPQEESMDHKSLLYGEDHARHAIAIHEGATDVWAVGPGAVGVSGIGYRRSQVLRMARFPVRVVCFNSEPEAQKRARKLCKELSAFPGETHNLQYSYKDAAETMLKKPQEIQYLRRTFLGNPCT